MAPKLTKEWTKVSRRVTASIRDFAWRLGREENGQDLIEYALMAATIAVAVAAIFPQAIGPNISTVFSKVHRR
jgi:Flp pilus assembly pilin Flp